MKNIYLVGFMGVGKTVTGRALAQRLKRDFVEMDEVIVARAGIQINDIFSKHGENYFRKLETDLLTELAAKDNLVVGCGGGLICNEQNLQLLKESGLVILLKAKALAIYERIKEHSHRPILNVKDPLAKIKTLLVERNSYYSQVDYSVDTDNSSVDDVVDKIIAIVNNG